MDQDDEANAADGKSLEPSAPPSTTTESSQGPVGAPPASPSGAAPRGSPPRGPLVRVLTHWSTGWFVAALLVGAIVGLSVALANSSGGPFFGRIGIAVPAPFQSPFGPFSPQFPNGYAASLGTVDSVGSSSFTMTGFDGEKVIVDLSASTTYRRSSGANESKRSLKKGDRVFVIGTRNGTTIKASHVISYSGSFPFPSPASGRVFVPLPFP